MLSLVGPPGTTKARLLAGQHTMSEPEGSWTITWNPRCVPPVSLSGEWGDTAGPFSGMHCLPNVGPARSAALCPGYPESQIIAFSIGCPSRNESVPAIGKPTYRCRCRCSITCRDSMHFDDVIKSLKNLRLMQKPQSYY